MLCPRSGQAQRHRSRDGENNSNSTSLSALDTEFSQRRSNAQRKTTACFDSTGHVLLVSFYFHSVNNYLKMCQVCKLIIQKAEQILARRWKKWVLVIHNLIDAQRQCGGVSGR